MLENFMLKMKHFSIGNALIVFASSQDPTNSKFKLTSAENFRKNCATEYFQVSTMTFSLCK